MVKLACFFISLGLLGGENLKAALEDRFLDHPLLQHTLAGIHDDVSLTLLHDVEAPPRFKGASEVYRSDFRLSKNVFFHPYHPNEATAARSPDQVIIFKNTLSIFLPTAAVWDQVPLPLQQFVKGPAHTSVRFVTQNLPWKAGTPLLVRPHYATVPDAPWQRKGYNRAQKVDFMVHALDGKKLTLGGASASLLRGAGISTHNGGGDLIVLSPASPALQGLEGIHGNFFWSACVSGADHFITLHWVLGEEDQKVLDRLVLTSPTLRLLRDQVGSAPLPPLVKDTLARLFA